MVTAEAPSEAQRFEAEVVLDDSLIHSIVLRHGAAECELSFDFAKRFVGDSKLAERRTMETLRPARLLLRGVRSFTCGDRYELNATVVNYGATEAANDLVEFFFVTTGGAHPEAFMARLTVIASSYSLEGSVVG